MNSQPLMLASFPRAILHVDGDAFFTSVEQALHPRLRGRPLVTGRERGIIACASYEAKACGVKRGVSLGAARKLCPGLVVLPSDYESYSLFSQRMFEIMRRYTPDVEEYSIDEGFADITGLRGVFRCSYTELARRLQQTIGRELDLTVSVGLSLTKSLAKIASDYRKPNGLTTVPGRRLHEFLPRIALAEVWGLGANRVSLLQKYGVRSAWDYVSRPLPWIRRMLHRPGEDIWHELRGTATMAVACGPRQPPASVSKSKTFSEPSADADYVYAKLVRNLESACIKLRRHRRRAAEVSVALRRKDYGEQGLCARLRRAAETPQEMLPTVRGLFERLYVPGVVYRATAATLTRLEDAGFRQYDLFESPAETERFGKLGRTMDLVNARYGKHTLFAGVGLHLRAGPVNALRDAPCWRKTHLLEGESARRRIRLPLLDLRV
jgi:DNA polymerase IV